MDSRPRSGAGIHPNQRNPKLEYRQEQESEVVTVFALEEYRRRIAATKERMAAAGIDVLIASHPANMNYLSGYDGWSYYVHQLVALALDDEDPVWIGREMDAAGARLTVFMDESRIHHYPDEYVDASGRHCMQRVAEILASLGWHRGRIGVEMDAWYFTARAHVELAERLPGARLVDAWPLVNWVRLVKSPPEIAMMRAAGRIVSRAMGVAVEAIAPGVRECDAVAQITRALFEGTPEHWGDYPATLPHAVSGARAAAPHLTWTGAPFEAGAATNIELGGCHHRYHAALARTLCLGAPPARLRTLASATAEGLHAALEAARPGAACEEVEAAWRRVIARAGYEKRSRIGYSIGLNYPPDWGEQSASLRAGDTTVLAPDMCFPLRLGMWMEGWGFELSETFRVTEGAPELLTHFPQELLVKE